MQCAYIVCVVLLWCERLCVRVCVCVCVRKYCIGSALQQIIAFCSVTVPIIETLQFALAMDGYNTAPKHYNARQLSTHLIFAAIISSMVITADPSHQPPLSSCAITCYRGAADGGGDGVKGVGSSGKDLL